MGIVLAYVTAQLRFPASGIPCRGDRRQRGCAAADGKAADAIHTFEGKHFCGYHSPFENVYVPCFRCDEKPALNVQAPTEGDPVCGDCLPEGNRVAERSYCLTVVEVRDPRCADSRL